MEIAAAQRFQDLGKLPRCPRRLNALVRYPFGEVQHALAPDEHRRAALLEVQPARIDLAEVHEQLGLVSLPYQHSNACDQLRTGEPSQILGHGIRPQVERGEVDSEHNNRLTRCQLNSERKLA
jgi:hypothetical protein